MTPVPSIAASMATVREDLGRLKRAVKQILQLAAAVDYALEHGWRADEMIDVLRGPAQNINGYVEMCYHGCGRRATGFKAVDGIQALAMTCAECAHRRVVFHSVSGGSGGTGEKGSAT